MSSKSLSARRANLMKKHPFCYWCDRKLIYFLMGDREKTPDDFATIDHINSRLMHPNGRPLIGRQVLSCPGCNQDRNKEEQKSLGLDELRRRAGNYRISSPSMMSSSLSEFSMPAAQSGERRDPMALARSENRVRARSI